LGRHPNPRVSGKPAEILPTQIFREPVLQTSAAMAPGGPHDGRRFNGAVAGLRSPNITLQRIG
ncbi:hypothetical protein, partial [Xanthomonas oryzae]|uniref:hypothetical protein n=1 Tax=Xanthomonas oryzae TaxID=347 RepID=UPI001C671997